jgi:uncharacterized protein (TIGR00725 family)
MKKLIAVFGPARCIQGDALFRDAEELGKRLARAGFITITGGYDGVMEAVSKGARSAGGSVVGVTAEVYFARGREANEFITREIRVKSATDRLMELLDLADAYVAIGNSTGTLAEVAMAWDYMSKGFLPQKPILLIGESWKRFMEYIEREDQFLPFSHFIEYPSDPEGAVATLETLFGTSLHLPDLDILSTEQ